MTLQLCMLSVKVKDIEEAKKFYCEKLNFKIEKVYNECLVELASDKLPIILEQVDESNTVDYVRQAQFTLGIQTNDLALEMKNLSDKGINFLYEEPQKCPPGIFNVIKDPSGNNIEILEFQ